MNSFETGILHCPHCGRPNNMVAGPYGSKPKDGDISVCFGCASINIFIAHDGILDLRRPDCRELTDLMMDPRVQTAVMAIKRKNGI